MRYMYQKSKRKELCGGVGGHHHCPLNDHSTLGSLSTCPLGAEVNDRLALCEREGEGGLKKIRGQLMLEKREFCCLFLGDHSPSLHSAAQFQVYSEYEKAVLIGQRGKLSSDTSYNLTGPG